MPCQCCWIWGCVPSSQSQTLLHTSPRTTCRGWCIWCDQAGHRQTPKKLNSVTDTQVQEMVRSDQVCSSVPLCTVDRLPCSCIRQRIALKQLDPGVLGVYRMYVFHESTADCLLHLCYHIKFRMLMRLCMRGCIRHVLNMRNNTSYDCRCSPSICTLWRLLAGRPLALRVKRGGGMLLLS